MSDCNFVNELNRLRKSSSDSIDNVESFNSFKKYMHVNRTVEEDLKTILRKVNSSGRKTLVLLCGSAGDGKSHLLSYLKNVDNENLIKDFTIFNDATESNAPDKNAIDTLNEILSPFSDNQIKNDGKNIILAINLGVLSNFVESEYGDNFTHLKAYVQENNILTTEVKLKDYDEDSSFQYVSFSDYHMYTLSKEGAESEYIENIFDKVFSQNADNPFYCSYEENKCNCTCSKKCPVKNNFEFLLDKKNRDYIVSLLIKVIIKEKFVLTTREIQNFIYDILVARDFSIASLQKNILNDNNLLQTYLTQITPTIIFSSKDVSSVLNYLTKYDPLVQGRDEKIDEMAIEYYVSTDVSEKIFNAFLNTPFENVLCNKDVLNIINNSTVLKRMMFSEISRMNDIKKTCEDNVFNMFLNDLYIFNSGKGQKLSKLYNLIERAVVQWCGSDEDRNICLNSKNNTVQLFEELSLQPSLNNLPDKTDEENIEKFIPYIIMSFKTNNDKEITLDIDYELYKLIYKLSRGYIQTVDDRNNHADFISFIDKILQTGSMNQKLILMLNNKKAIMSKDIFGYKFKVVK